MRFRGRSSIAAIANVPRPANLNDCIGHVLRIAGSDRAGIGTDLPERPCRARRATTSKGKAAHHDIFSVDQAYSYAANWIRSEGCHASAEASRKIACEESGRAR